jgi:4-hydroxyphenylpyruvate dioxygenase
VLLCRRFVSIPAAGRQRAARFRDNQIIPEFTMSTASTPKAAGRTGTAADPLRLVDVDYVHFYVGNAKQSAYFYAQCFGFEIEQVSDLTTGSREVATYLLTQGNIRFLISTGLDKDSPLQEEVRLYGDGIKDIAFNVEDAVAAYEQALKNGAESAYEPVEVTDEDGTVVKAGIKTLGRVWHSFVSRTGKYELEKIKKNRSLFMPGYRSLQDLAINEYNRRNPVGLFYVDHCVGNVQLGKMDYWVKWYEDVLGFKLFKHFDDKDISTEYSALMSKVMDSGRELIKIPINEPAEGKRKSQIEEYLDWHNNTPGIQHLALLTKDEIHSVGRLRERGVDFLEIPETYYDIVWDRVGEIKEDTSAVKDLRVLVDRDDKGYLLQIFTKPLQDRPTLFFEIICRRGSESFGKGNFKALFESLELEQERRGNL